MSKLAFNVICIGKNSFKSVNLLKMTKFIICLQLLHFQTKIPGYYKLIWNKLNLQYR